MARSLLRPTGSGLRAVTTTVPPFVVPIRCRDGRRRCGRPSDGVSSRRSWRSCHRAIEHLTAVGDLAGPSGPAGAGSRSSSRSASRFHHAWQRWTRASKRGGGGGDGLGRATGRLGRRGADDGRVVLGRYGRRGGVVIHVGSSRRRGRRRRGPGLRRVLDARAERSVRGRRSGRRWRGPQDRGPRWWSWRRQSGRPRQRRASLADRGVGDRLVDDHGLRTDGSRDVAEGQDVLAGGEAAGGQQRHDADRTGRTSSRGPWGTSYATVRPAECAGTEGTVENSDRGPGRHRSSPADRAALRLLRLT